MATTPMTKAQATRRGLEPYYGFAHDKAFVIRTPSRAYSGTTQTVPFTGGQAQIPAVPGASPEQRWNRGERLQRMRELGYAIYELGTEPPAREEPLWAGQDEPASDAFETDFGASFGPRKGFDVRAMDGLDEDDDEDDD